MDWKLFEGVQINEDDNSEAHARNHYVTSWFFQTYIQMAKKANKELYDKK